ncbi:MAG: S41 family peptidase [Anaerolineaceae bacterium]
MENKTVRSILLVLVAVLLLAGTFALGFGAASVLPKNPIRQALGYDTCATVEPQIEGEQPQVATPNSYCLDYTSASTPEDLKGLFDPFWESWKLLHENFVDQPLDDVALMRGAIQGMLAATGDKHTSYMDPEQFKQANTEMEGEYTGIGAWVDTTGDYVEIISPMKGSPAEAAGLQAQDKVIAINGEDMTGIPGDLVLQKILGPAGDTIVLTIRRGEETFDVSITRAVIQIPVVEYEMREDGVGYVALYTFNELATEKLREALKDLLAQNPKGIVFDLRGNGGGYLVTAVEVTSEFLKDGVVLYEEYGDGTRDSYPVKKGGLATEIPLVVLIDEGTASAAEITAGALQDYGRAKLVGKTSYGKGSVQNWIPLKSEESGVRITIARWLTPNGKQIDGVGLTPDLVVEYTQEDFDAGRDPQLDAAVELLLSELP